MKLSWPAFETHLAAALAWLQDHPDRPDPRPADDLGLSHSLFHLNHNNATPAAATVGAVQKG